MDPWNNRKERVSIRVGNTYVHGENYEYYQVYYMYWMAVHEGYYDRGKDMTVRYIFYKDY